ncbi:hypothetical protein Hte_002147 [Hypoxylon texense]
MPSPQGQDETDNNYRSHDDYAVGWVCALPKEAAAAMAMLDERHPDLPKPANDPNTYTLGSIGNHNIVVACLPKGKIGTNSAANVVNQMIRTFPAIRVGLMVGIGGGIPPHVRLGDVVVSAPVYEYPGVVQWDFGILEDGSQLKRIGALNSPPISLLTALTKLEAEHRLTRPKMHGYLEERRQKYPDSSPTFIRTAALRDMLFKASYSHIQCPPVQSWLHVILSYFIAVLFFPIGLFDQGTSSSQVHSDGIGSKQDDEETMEDACQYCDKSQVVSRKPRGMLVHQGLIASGNKVIKDAAFRDNLNEKFGGNVLCVEMEAAGLMDNFPCVVIRGICDYADSHKNYAWQEHAAAIAAAFAKEFLGYVQPSEVALEQPAKEIMRHVAEIGRDVKKLQSIEEGKENLRMLDWLSPLDHGSQQSSILTKWHPETNQWFLGSDTLQEWLENRGKSLYCPGIPGAGKTVLTSTVINYLNDRFSTRQDVGIAYLYCTFSRKETLEDYLTSLLKQLARKQHSRFLGTARDLYEKHRLKGTRPSYHELSHALQTGLTLATYDRVFIIIDALDECTIDNECRVKLIREVSSLQAKHGVNIFATSRIITEIAEQFQNALVMPIRAADNDMKMYMDKRLSAQDDELFGNDIRETIISKVVEVTGGMFLLAELYLNSLIALPTRGHIKHALSSLEKGPAGLDAAYSLTMGRIQSQGKEYYELARQILTWIIYAAWPLRINEIQHALATRPGMKVFDDDFVPSVKKLISACAGLVTVEGNDIIRLFHYTAQDYLRKTENEWCPDDHAKLATVCMTYIPFVSPALPRETTPFPFYDYALHNWGYHARISSNMNSESVVSFLEQEASIRVADLALADLDEGRCIRKATGLHLAAYYGIEEAVLLLLDRYNIDAGDYIDRTPLQYAAMRGHKAVFEQLVKRGANLNVRDARLDTPLYHAFSNGHAHIVRLILASEQVDPNKRMTELNITALWGAAHQGHASVVETLLESSRVDPNQVCGPGSTAISAAANDDRVNIIQMLLDDERVDPNSQDYYGQTALIKAVQRGHAEVVKVLLASKRVNPHIKDFRGNTPLSIATGNQNQTIIGMLLAAGKKEIIEMDSDTDERTSRYNGRFRAY